MAGLTDWWKSKSTRREGGYPDTALWNRVSGRLPLLVGLNEDELARLQELTVRFLRDKVIEAAQGIQLDQAMRLEIAIQACLPVLNLDLSWYRGWYALILYPEEFIPNHEWVDEAGVVWQTRHPMSGEAWEQGPVILSWADVMAGRQRDGFNVVIHELAHKLDMLGGAANGRPNLHRDMEAAIWTRHMGRAYEELCQRVDRGEETPIDPYATESPAEFFAVCSEAFFELPLLLDSEYPDVYVQLRTFYKQDPLSRMPTGFTFRRAY